MFLRTGIVLSTKGGALGKVLPLFKAGVGGRLGSASILVWGGRSDGRRGGGHWSGRAMELVRRGRRHVYRDIESG